MWIVRKSTGLTGVREDIADLADSIAMLFFVKEDAEEAAEKLSRLSLNFAVKDEYKAVQIYLLEAHGTFDESIGYEVERSFNERNPPIQNNVDQVLFPEPVIGVDQVKFFDELDCAKVNND